MHNFNPPMRDGISASCIFLDNQQHYATFFDFLCQKFPHISPFEWQQRFVDGLVFSENGQIIQLSDRYQGNQHLYYYRHLAEEIEIPFEHILLFENNDLIVVDKPHFLVVSPTGQYVQQTLLTRLKKISNNPDISPIHRLDRETAGIILFSKNRKTRGLYQQLFAEKKVQKTYHAIARFDASQTFPQTFSSRMEKGTPFYTMKIVDGMHNSQTHIELIENNKRWAKYKLNPVTGKQHQLRVHMNALGLPLRYDNFYPEPIHSNKNDFSKPLQLLAKQIKFVDPVTLNLYSFCSTRELLLPKI